jgi:SAM-dependent methyltransferase
MYESGDRPEVVPFIPDGIASLLDVGCGSGGFGGILRGRFGPGLRLVGVEPMPEARALAEVAGFDQVVPGYFPDAIEPGEAFDCIVFNDVLEHMVDPWSALRDAHRHLTPGGTVVASLPSVLYLPVLARVIARRRWDYTEAGTLDRTHLRFFTKATMADMFAEAGYRVVSVQGINNDWYTGRWGRLKRLAPLAGQFQWLQFVVVATPA